MTAIDMIRQATFIVGVLASICASVAGQQATGFDDLEMYLNKKMVGPEATKVIMTHLIESGTNAPLENLVAWAKTGFPDLHDEHGIWKTEGLSLKLGVVTSICYYFSTSPSPNQSTGYLKILDDLKSDDYISYFLTGMAYQFIDRVVLERRVVSLLNEKDPNLRSQGIHMGRTLAKENQTLFVRYEQMLKSDEDAHVRTTILSSMLGWRRKDVALLAFDRLLSDSNDDVRKLAARGLEIAAEHRILTTDDLPTLLPAMLRTNDSFVRVSIGFTAARLSTATSLYIRSDTFNDQLLYNFIQLVREKGTRMHSALSDAELAKEWLAWWTPLIPEYTRRIEIVQ